MNEDLTIKALKAENARLKEENSAMRDQIAWLRRKVFGSASDKRAERPADAGEGTDIVQMTLFDDEYLKAYEEAKETAEKEARKIQKDEGLRKDDAKKSRGRTPRTGKTPKWESLERRDTYLQPEGINLDEYVCIGEDKAEVLRRDAAKFWVEVQHRPKHILREDIGKDNVKVEQAPPPTAAIPGNHVAAGVLAWLIVNKFQWSVPEYRQSSMMRQQGVILPTSTVNGWMHACADKLYLLYVRLKRYCLDGRYRIDNNACEQGNRTPVLGRKNYLFSANDKYAQDNAVFYSLIETCVDLGVDPLGWLTKVLSLPLLDMDDDALDSLLPQYQYKGAQDNKVRE